MATLENRLILLGTVDLPAIGKVNYYHRYTIYTKDSGEQWVFRSGPSGDASPTASDMSADIIGGTSDDWGNLSFTSQLYRNADGGVPYSVDSYGDKVFPADSIYSTNSNSGFDSRLHLRDKQVITGTDSELDSIVSRMLDRGFEVNDKKYPYSPSNQNSNTGDAYITDGVFDYENAEYEPIEGTGTAENSLELRQQIEANGGTISGKKIFAPATGEDFESTVNTATVAWDLVESSVEWVYEHTGKPLVELITEAGSTVYDWAGDVAKAIGTTSANLFNGAKDFFSDLFGFEDDKLTAYDGDRTIQLANSGMIATDAVYVDENGNPTSIYDSLFETKDSSGNKTTFIRDGVKVKAKDDTFVSLSSVVKTIDSAQATLSHFMDSFFKESTAIFTTPEGVAGMISDVSAGIQRGDSAEQIAAIIATKAVIRTLANEVQNEIIFSEADQDLIYYGKFSELSSEGKESLQMVQGNPYYKTAYTAAIAFATSVILNADEGWDSEQYTQAAVQAVAQASAQIAVSSYFGATPAASGVGAAAAHLVSTAINDLFADDHMNSHQWKSAVTTAGALGAAAYAGSVAGAAVASAVVTAIGASAATAAAIGAFAGPIGAVVAVIIVTQFMGGKEYGPGEYPDPYSYLKIEAKEDGTGNKIIGIESEGVVAIAREYYHDDIYGTSGSDNLVGKSGTNTIYGYGGNDHLEGRGDIDLLVAGDGDDEAFGGNGDDQIYGGNGNDNLFGGNGNDVIIGGTGASISGEGSLEDGADFIQGGNGDDQIMGEAGDDTIQGNAGNDTIIGGTGNDRIEGNEGEDSILGEDGDDMILGQVGSDIIDGGAGEDYIEGNEGNDNIRGGDGNDEILGNSGVDIIYGDAGNDLINTGSENDLAFGGLGNDIIYGAGSDDTLSGELGNDYVIGAEGADTIDGGAGDDILFGEVGNDTITTGEGNDTIIYRAGDGQDTITDTDTSGSDTLRLTEINSKLSNNTTNKLVLSKSGTDLIIQFKNDSGSIITSDKITVTNQFGGSEANGTGSEILKKIEFADGKAIDLTNITINGDNSISYTTSTYSNIDTSIQEELALGYNDQMQYRDEQENPDSTYNASNYNNSGEQEEIDSEKYNEMQWRSKKEKRSAFGGHYTVWYKYYEQNLSGTSGNDRLVGHWWSENVYGGNGDDQLHGGDGNDTLYGGDGNDILHGGAGADNVYGQSGEDLIYGGSGNDNLDGGLDNDTIYANEGNDTVTGSTGDDYLEGNGGNDALTDNEGNNIIIAGGGIDIINAGAGNDKIEGNEDSDTINAGDGNNLIYGNGGNDGITAGAGNDTIYGQEGSDLINAGAGDDYISGGAGDDLINSEDGADTIYGDLGIDQISGGAGNDHIYGGAAADILKGDAGNDQIKGGDSDDWIEGGADNDSLYGQSGSDKIYGDAGNDTIDGGIEGDVLEGGAGNDTIIGGQGNDILVDGAGSDVLDGGNDSDIIILTTEIDADGNTAASTSIDTIKNFSKTEDKIILKTSYKTPISFADIQSNMTQNGSNVEIALDNGQQIIIENITTSDLTSSNFQIGLSGGENNDILFGTDGEDILFGDEGDDKIYGGDGNDELWGGKGSDELYGEGGDDILRYEADGKYGSGSNDVTTVYDANVNVKYSGHTHNYGHPAHYFEEIARHYRMRDGLNQVAYDPNNDVVIDRVDAVSKLIDSQNGTEVFHDDSGKIGDFEFFTETSKLKSYGYLLSDGILRSYPGPTSEWNMSFVGSDLQEYEYTKSNKYSVKNFHNSSLTDITGYNRTFDKFIGGSGVNTILMTEGNDVIALDDPTSASGSDAAGASASARISDISVIHAGAGDDVINFSTQKYSYGDTVVYGGTGNDKIWLSSGNDQIFGQEGNDEIYSGAGNDELNGGSGDDLLYAGLGDDTLEGGSGTNQLYGEDGDDIFIAGSGADTISGGNGSDTISYVNSASAVTINLSTNSISGGDAANDTISSIENIIGSAFNDSLTGNSSANTINGGSGNDSLSGGVGSDLYIYNLNSGTDTITETGTDSDSLRFAGGVTASDLTFAVNGNDLEIQVGASSANKVIIKDQVTQNYIETIKINPVFNISKKFFIAKEDESLAFANPLNETNSQRRNFESLTALYGTLVFDEALNQFTYKSNSNFHGIDEVEIVEEDGTKSKFTVFVNGINDAPIFSSLGEIQNKEIKVEEEWSVNLKDYFFDADGDALSLSLKLQGFDNLPDWVNFNSQTGIVSGRIGRDGKLNFTVTASDSSGAFLSDNFRINITRNIADDIRPVAPVVQVTGTDAADIITATPDSSDIIMGGAGDDEINYTKDNDWVPASDGSYYIAWNVYSGDEIAVTGKQRSFDAFDGGDGYDKLNLTDQNDVIFLDDAIVSNIGEIAKLSSIEEIDAGDGDDVVDLTSLTFSYDDVILKGGRGNDVLWGNDGDDTINGDDGDDNLQGGKGDDVISGGIGNDTIKGYDGNDQINGGAGFDVMIGGNGSDQFVFTDKTDSTASFNNLSETDIISDFIQNEDKIDISALDFDSITQGQGSNSSANGLEFYFKNGYTVIDDPNSNFAIKLAGEVQLGASDFMFN